MKNITLYDFDLENKKIKAYAMIPKEREILEFRIANRKKIEVGGILSSDYEYAKRIMNSEPNTLFTNDLSDVNVALNLVYRDDQELYPKVVFDLPYTFYANQCTANHYVEYDIGYCKPMMRFVTKDGMKYLVLSDQSIVKYNAHESQKCKDNTLAVIPNVISLPSKLYRLALLLNEKYQHIDENGLSNDENVKNEFRELLELFDIEEMDSLALSIFSRLGNFGLPYQKQLEVFNKGVVGNKLLALRK